MKKVREFRDGNRPARGGGPRNHNNSRLVGSSLRCRSSAGKLVQQPQNSHLSTVKKEQGEFTFCILISGRSTGFGCIRPGLPAAFPSPVLETAALAFPVIRRGIIFVCVPYRIFLSPGILALFAHLCASLFPVFFFIPLGPDSRSKENCPCRWLRQNRERRTPRRTPTTPPQGASEEVLCCQDTPRLPLIRPFSQPHASMSNVSAFNSQSYNNELAGLPSSCHLTYAHLFSFRA